MKFIKEHWLQLIILILLCMLIFSNCHKDKTKQVTTTVIKRDTTIVIKQDVHHTEPTLVKTITVTKDKWDVKYLPDTNYGKLYEQYLLLAKLYMAQNIYSDSTKIDSIGFISVIDTITHNGVKGRKIGYNLHYPTITNTITTTVQEKQKRMLYVGIGLEGNKTQIVNQFNAGLIYKNKRNNLFGFQAGVTSGGVIQFGISKYWKIKL